MKPTFEKPLFMARNHLFGGQLRAAIECILEYLDSSPRREGGSDGEPTVEEWEALEETMNETSVSPARRRQADEAFRKLSALRTAGRGKDSALSARIIPYAGPEWAAEFRQGERTARLEYEAGEPTVLTCNVPGGPSYIEFQDAALALRRAYEWLVGNHVPTAPESETVADGQGEDPGARYAIAAERQIRELETERGQLREKLAAAETDNGHLREMLHRLAEDNRSYSSTCGELRGALEKAESARDEAELKVKAWEPVVRQVVRWRWYDENKGEQHTPELCDCLDGLADAIDALPVDLRPDPIPSKGGGK